MELSVNKIRRSVAQLRQHLQSTQQTADEDSVLLAFMNKNDPDENDVEALFSYLSERILEKPLTAVIATSFEYVLLLLITRSIPIDGRVDESNYEIYQKKCIALSTMMRLSVDTNRYAVSYFRNKPAPFECSTLTEGTTSIKRSKNNVKITSLDIVKCCYHLLCANPVFFKDLWNWSVFIEQFIDGVKESDLYQLYCNHIIAILTNMTTAHLQVMNAQLPPAAILQFDEERNLRPTMKTAAFKNNNKDKIINLKINSHLVTDIENVLLHIFNKENYEFYTNSDGVLHENIVKVDSTKVNLRSIALGIASAKAICLSGPVGCGKTTLVEYLARRTGRIYPKPTEIEQRNLDNLENSAVNNGGVVNGNDKLLAGYKRKHEQNISKNFEQNLDPNGMNTNGFLRIQLGDQTDSKMLLGQYRCTDVPGEFVWLPGVLTQAVMNGYWLLLEDLDSATQDTYTILSSLLENNYLSVPGFRDCVKIEPGFQLFVTVRTNKSSTSAGQKSLFALLEKYLYTINILPLSRNELCKVVSTNYPRLATVANRIVDVFLTFSSGDHTAADNLRQQESGDKADTTEKYVALPFEQVSLSTMTNSSRLVSTRDLIKLCQRSNPVFSVTSVECAYFVFQNAVDVFCSYLPQGENKTKLITSIGAKLGIIQSRCEYFAKDYKPEVFVDVNSIKVGRTELQARSVEDEVSCKTNDTEDETADDGPMDVKRQKLDDALISLKRSIKAARNTTFSFTRMASCILERIAVCVSHAEPVLLVGETGVGKTSSVQYLAERTYHKLVVVNMNNQSDVSDLIGGFKPVDLTYVVTPLRLEFDTIFRSTFNVDKNQTFLHKMEICYNQGNFYVILRLMQTVINSVFGKVERNELREKELAMLPRWQTLKVNVQKLLAQLSKSINISFAFIPGSLVNCIKNGDWILLDEINLASAEMLECLSTILERDGSVVLLERGDFTPVKRHPDFRILACMNPNTDIGKKDLPVGIRNRFTEFFVDELTTDVDLTLLISDYLKNTGIQRKSVASLVQLYKKLKLLSKLELNDGLGNRPVFSLRTLCRSLHICAKNLCGSIERNLYESFCMSFLTQLDPVSHNIVLQLIQQALLSNAKAVLSQGIPKPGENYLNFEGYWIQQGPKEPEEYASYILTKSVKENLRDLARIISIGKLPVLLQGPTSAGKTSLIDYVARRSGNHCLRINNHEHTDLQEYIGTYVADVTGKLSFKEGVLVQAMRNGYWIILDELNLASTDILEALNRVLDDNRELFIPETQTLVKAHPNFMLFATQNPPGLYGGRKTLSRAFKNRFIELHFSDIPRDELEVILEKRCLIPNSYAKKMVMCMSDLQKNRKTTSKNVFTLRDLFRWGNRYTYADKQLLKDDKYDWNQHLIEEGYLVLSAKVRTDIEIEIIEETLYKNFRKRIDLGRLFDAQSSGDACSAVTRNIITAIKAYKLRADIVWTRNMTRMAVLTAKALQFNEPVLLVGPTGCGKTTVCQLLASIRGVQLRILNCHMHTEGADFLGGLRPCRESSEQTGGTKKLFEWADGPLILAMQEGSYFMADEISLAEDSVLERLNCILEPQRTVLLAEKGGVSETDNPAELAKDFVVQAKEGFQFLATMNPGGDFGKKELSPALRNRFTEIWCLPSDTKEDLIQIASNCMMENSQMSVDTSKDEITKIASYLVEVVLYMRYIVEKFKFSIRDILAWANYIASNAHLTFAESAIFGLETIFLDALELLPHESFEKVELLRKLIIQFAIKKAAAILNEKFSLDDLAQKRGTEVTHSAEKFGIKPFFIPTNARSNVEASKSFLFEAPTTKQNLFRLLSALSLNKPILLEGPPGVGKTSTVESIAAAVGYRIVRINLCEHTDLADLFGTDLPAEDNILDGETVEKSTDQSAGFAGAFVWRDGPLLAALKADNTWILLDELNLAPQSVLEGLNAILDHRGEVYIPELNKTFTLSKETRVFACQNPLKQGGGRKGLPQSFLNRFNKVYLRKLTTQDLLFVVNGKYEAYFENLRMRFAKLLEKYRIEGPTSLFEFYKKSSKDVVSVESATEAESRPTRFTLDVTKRLVEFSELLDNGIAALEFGHRGGPFEINLRDILRWCDLLVNPDTGFIFQSDSCSASTTTLELFRRNFENFLLTVYERMKLVYYQRMRCEEDKRFIRNAFGKVFECDADQLNVISEDVSLYWTSEKIYLNDIVLERVGDGQALRPLRSNDLCPILLTSQREMVKNMVECVRMEKPVLLCGPTDTGKTKLIDLLCTLTNQVCNTDTIDDSVTGSFQQIDLNRHLEEISQSVESVLAAQLRCMILERPSKAYKAAAELLQVWGAYAKESNVKLATNNATSMSEELTSFRKRIQRLNKVITVLLATTNDALTVTYSTSTKEKLQQQQNRLSILENHVRNADTLNTGGSFEWVDSKIVKSLKCGQYILLEHVNLCSSAVLDRLNPVFEPNGNLLISEKGVSANECAEIVEKAPNFRAFLTIDPKNGELSRAMRNRCVELAIAKDPYSVDDMRLIVYNNGVRGLRAINCILDIHKRLMQSTEINNYNITHLAQFAFLTASYARIGYDMERAIYVSGMEVYVYAANTDLMGFGLPYYQNQLREIVLAESKKFAANAAKYVAADEDRLRDIVLHSDELHALSLIKLQTEPLRSLLRHNEDAQNVLTEMFADFAHVDLTKVEQTQLLKYYIYMLYECSSIGDAELRYLYLTKLLNSQADLQNLSQSLFACIKHSSTQFESTPDELPWNNKLFPRIRAYASQPADAKNHKSFCLSAQLVAHLLLLPLPQPRKININDTDALAYSQALAAGGIADRYENVLLQNLAIFMASLREVLSASLDYAHIDLSTFSSIVTAYLWYNRLLSIAQEQLVERKQLNRQLMDKLVLHFKWLEKNLLRLLTQMLPNYCQLNADFNGSLLKINNYIVSIKEPLNLMRKVYNKHLTHFAPFYQEKQINFYRLVRTLDQLLAVVPTYGSFTHQQVLKKFLAQNSVDARRARAIINKCLEQQINTKFKRIQQPTTRNADIPETLHTALVAYVNNTTEDKGAFDEDLDGALQTAIGALKSVVNSPENLELATEPKEFNMRLLALREFYLAKALNSIGNGGTQINEVYCEEITSLSSATWQLIKVYNSSAFKSYEKVWSELLKHLESIESVSGFEALLEYLNGSYRFFNSYHAQLQNAVNSMQLYNLGTRETAANVLRTAAEVDCSYTYDGCSFLNVFCSLIFEENGCLRPVPLNELSDWQATLKQLQHLLWQNANLLTAQHSDVRNNLLAAQRSAKKLLHEAAYVKKVCDSMENENFSEYNEHFQQLLYSLTAASDETTNSVSAQQSNGTLHHQTMLYKAALLNSLVGALEVCLLTFTPLIDPVEKNRLKNLYVVEDINCLTTMTTAYDFMRIIMKYKHLGTEMYNAFETRLQFLQSKQQKYAQKLALRPTECLYPRLVDDVTHYLKTNCAPQALHILIQSAQKAWRQLTSDFQAANAAQILSNSTEVVNKLNLWITNSQRFLNHTLKAYMEHYQDFIQPLQYSIDHLRYGFEGLKVALTQVASNILQLTDKKVYTNLNADDRLSHTLASIAEFPACRQLFADGTSKSSSTRAILKQRSYVNSVLKQLPHSEHTYFRLLKAKLIELRNSIKISAHIDEGIFSELDYIFSVSNQIWQAEEERRRAQKAEEESLYVNKTRCAEEDEELLELQEIEAHFPTNVEEDFGDFLIEATLEKVVKLDKKANLKTQKTQVIRDEDYTFLATNFIELMAQYTHVYYHKHGAGFGGALQLEFIEPFQARMQAFVPLYAHYKRGLNDWLAEAAYNSCTLALALQKEQLKDAGTTLLVGKTAHNYNYYKDANLPEILGCMDLLKDIELIADSQLALYPEHASLIDIKRVIERIRTLPANAPVVRFNTGFQLLRQKLAQWNEVAHKGNHMREQEVAVAEYVQRWMKLELQCWRNCLNQTKLQIEANTHKYWFYIYQLLQEYLHERELDSSYMDIRNAEKRFGEGELLDDAEVAQKTKVNADDIVRILRQFVEAANYGDFHVRLQLLQAFELYLHNVAQLTLQSNNDKLTADARALIAGLHNLQIYFAQFAQEIDETAQSMRTPIEKKLKELVKIESYNKDLSYFSMRNNVARVHRNLNKFLKEYQQQLQQKITPVFQPKDATVKDYNFENDKGRELRYDTRIKYYLVEVKNFVAGQKLAEKYGVREEEVVGNELITESHAEQKLLNKVERLFKTSRNVVKETVSNANFSNLIIALDSVLCSQLERCDELRALSVDRSKERPKQLLEAKQILQQKRKGLTDLFKTLTQLGLSFKAGLMELSLRTDFTELTLPPFCIKTMLGARSDKRLHTNVLHLNENLDRYYAKCEFKLRLLQNIMLAPLSELGPPNIERIKGFAVDMFLLVQNQRRLLANTSKQIYDLNVHMQHIKEIYDICSLGDLTKAVEGLAFSEARDSYLVLRESISRMRYVLEQFSLLLACAPSGESVENTVLAQSECHLLQNLPYYATIVSNCDEVLQTAKATLVEMLKNDKEFLNVERVTVYKATHDKLYQTLQKLVASLSTAAGEPLPIAKPIVDLLNFVNSSKERLAALTRSAPPVNLENLDVVLEHILHEVLLALQKLYKKYTQSPSGVTEESFSPGKARNELELQEKHLKEQLHAALESDWQMLNIANIVEQLSNVLLTLKHASPSQSKLVCARKLTTLMPILEQYYLLADYYLFQQLGAHKVSAKMLSVMLTVFVEIGSKGFCVPPDLMQDEEGQAKDQKDGEGFGLEDGTGENDATDKIESEDQLDDAKRPEDRKNEENKQPEDCKEDKSIDVSEDFNANAQDLEKPEEDDSGESENEEDEMDKEMGETGAEADKLDEQIWGDDEEQKEEEEEENEQEEDQGKGTKDEKDTHNDLDAKNDAANETEQENEGLDAANDVKDDKRKQQEKDIDNMKEPEVDEDQPNPYHNELEEPPEPEEMDLGDMNADNEQEEGADEREGEENPFDIDKMKENMENVDEQSKEEEGKEENEVESKSDDSDSEDGEGDTELRKEEKGDEDKPEEEDEEAEDETEAETQTRGEQELDTGADERQEENEKNEEREEKPEDYEQSKDKTSKEENMQSVPETENKGTPDEVQSENDQDVKQDQKLDEQETGEEKDGVGQAENETNDGGHQGIAETKEQIAQDENAKEQKPQEKRKQGKTNEERTLGEAEEKKIKQLKTIDKMKEQKVQQEGDEDNDNEKEADAEEFQHVKEAKKNDKTTLDNATEEQSKQIQHQEDEEQEGAANEEDGENNEQLEEAENAEKMDEDEQNLEEMSAEKFDNKSEKPSKTERSKEHTETEEEMEVEGEVVQTMTVARNDDTTAHCNKEILLEHLTRSEELSTAEMLEMRQTYQQQLATNKTTLPVHEDYDTWQTVSTRMSQNARELCEQLRLILEPTKCTRLKGDYRTGRRINMKKIIPYIASQFRKDKIWLRRTKAAQRDYKITIAIDDSKSMHHNNSKTLTLEAISLVSQALTLLESGRLSIISFGESPQIILNHTEQFDGPKLVNALNFAQDKTKIAELLDFVRTANTEEAALGTDNGLFENLLLVLSDGRNIFSEGRMKVRNAIKLARLQRIFLVYIIIDNPENKDSILDIQTMEMLPDKRINIKSYLDDFPFPYYVIVRDLNQLPLVLSEAMRQWFELVNSEM
ncbi:midasin [Ceratitis capitata]|uniref:midasin n=1 Tax=Ceratitis capitata TaxID=7213 RepID=UPI00032A2ED1|nr:midasin [Ceratitis capitata]